MDNNPFAALISTTKDTKELRRQHSKSDEHGIIKSDEQSSTMKSSSETKKNTENTEEKERLSNLIENVFLLTLNAEPGLNRPDFCVYLEELSKSLSPQDWLDKETIDHALFERLLLQNVEKCVIKTTTRKARQRCTAGTRQIVIYLYESYDRACMYSLMSEFEDDLEYMKELVIRNLVTAFQQPDLYADQQLNEQLKDLMFGNIGVNRNCHDFVGTLLKQLKASVDTEPNTIRDLLAPTFDVLREEFEKCHLMTWTSLRWNMFDFISTNEVLASQLIAYSTPSDATTGVSYSTTLLGSFFTLSCLPKSEMGQFEFFENPSSVSQQVHSNTEGNIWTALSGLIGRLHGFVYNILKCSKKVRSEFLAWLGACFEANSGRLKMWNAHFGHSFAPDSFFLNIGAVLAKLSEPFCSDPRNPKLIRVDHVYPQAPSAKVHLKGLEKETPLIPKDGESEVVMDNEFNFPTECFFFTHRALQLGFMLLYEKYTKLNQELGRIQRLYQEASSQSGVTSDGIQNIKESMERGMTRYLSIKAAMFEPKNLQLNMQFLVSSSVWLTQIATADNLKDPQRMYQPISFPLPLTENQVLSTIPEFIAENIIKFLICLRRFSSKTIDEAGDTLEHIMTFILVFMGSPNRMKNPHLRAKLAECLEALVPSDDNSRFILTFHRERLWREHPHIQHLVSTLLHVFVSIEMTGQSVQFEQKFNYRRPMYFIMEYTWKEAIHKQQFCELAKLAEQNMEAVDPPLFLRFINLLMNDGIFLLDEALQYMTQLRQQQTARDSGEWDNLSRQQRRQNERDITDMGMLAIFHNVMGRETIKSLEMITTAPEIRSIFCHPTLVARIAAMLNYFLLHLVGPKKKNLKVLNMAEYEFKPGDVVQDICKIYLNLSGNESFCLAVSQDKRSYSANLFRQAEAVLAKIAAGYLIPEFQTLASRIQMLDKKQEAVDEMLGDIPEEFLDPIMSTLMEDPVVLPSSGKTIDRSTIARHLLSDQTDPFNRAPLTMDMVESNDDMKRRISEWMEKRKEAGMEQ